MKMIVNGLLSVSIFLLVTCEPSYSQQQLRARSEFASGIIRIENITNFSELQGMSLCCSSFSSATSHRPLISIGGEWPLTKTFLVGFRIGIANYSDQYYATANAPIIIGNEVHQVRYTTTLSTDIAGVNIDILPKYFPLGGVWVSAGLRTSILLDHFASISVDATSSEYRTSLSNGSTYFSAVGSIGYEIPLDKDGVLLLNPSLGTSLGLTDYNDVDWKINTLFAQIGIVWQWGSKLIDDADTGEQFQ